MNIAILSCVGSDLYGEYYKALRFYGLENVGCEARDSRQSQALIRVARRALGEFITGPRLLSSIAAGARRVMQDRENDAQGHLLPQGTASLVCVYYSWMNRKAMAESCLV
jgi:hypothetical protein